MRYPGPDLVPFAVEALGRPGRDAIAFMTLSWISGFNDGKKFGVYCSDVSGAFDRVPSGRVIAKLAAKGLCGCARAASRAFALRL